MEFQAFGPILIARNLVEDAFGTLSRAWERDSKGEIHPIFLRRFAPCLRAPSVTEALQRSLGSLELPASCGSNHQLGLRPSPHWTLNHQTSRSLRRIQEKCRQEDFPLELALSLHVAWTLAHVCARFWRLGQSVGSLSLDSIRIDFEGGLFLPDLGWLPTLIHLADEDPALRAALPELPRGPVEGDLTQEAQRFGAFLVELITFEAVPAGLSPAQALDQAQFWTPQGPQPLPVSVRQGLARLVGGAEPYETLEGALKAFEKIVYEDEDGPSTFSLAHLMHILFRQDYERQRDQLDLELATLRQEDKLWAAKPTRSSKGVLAAGLLAAAAAGIGTYMLMRNHESPGRTEASAPPPAQVQLPRQEPPQRPVQAVQSPGLPPQARPKHDPLPAREPVLPQKEGNVRTAPSSPKPTAAPSGAGVQDRPAQIRSLAHFPWPQGVPRETVSLRVFIHEDGHPLRATVVPGASPAPRITQAACEAAMKSTFLPAIRNGKAVRDWVQVQFN